MRSPCRPTLGRAIGWFAATGPAPAPRARGDTRPSDPAVAPDHRDDDASPAKTRICSTRRAADPSRGERDVFSFNRNMDRGSSIDHRTAPGAVPGRPARDLPRVQNLDSPVILANTCCSSASSTRPARSRAAYQLHEWRGRTVRSRGSYFEV